MSSFMSKINPTSRSIQQEYVEKRLRALHKNDPAKTDRVRKKIEAAMTQHARKGEWHDFYLKLHGSLQTAELTINFDAGKWFTQDNLYPTYSQMYERAVGTDGKMRLTDNDPLNPARVRAVTDDFITVPDEWRKAMPGTQRRRLHDAMSVSGASLSKVVAKRSNAQDPAMSPALKVNADSTYSTSNKSFKPKSRQIFAALNYGRRLHGATTEYGFSHLVLNPVLKEKAIYYPEDTFYIGMKGTSTQTTFNTIGAVVEHASTTMMRVLWSSCVDNIVLPDTDQAAELMEAHLFQELKVAEDVQAMVLSRMRKRSEPPFDDQQWRNIVDNARIWCRRNHVRLIFSAP